jgi:hypothetical protein
MTGKYQTRIVTVPQALQVHRKWAQRGLGWSGLFLVKALGL